MKPGDQFTLSLAVSGAENGEANITATISSGGKTATLTWNKIPRNQTSGYFGVAGRGLIDFSIDQVDIDPGGNKPNTVGHADCCACYPLGDSLTNAGGIRQWASSQL